jgi:hypothetical protein
VSSALDVVQFLQVLASAFLLVDAAHRLLLSARQFLLGQRRVPRQAAHRALVVDRHVAALDEFVRRLCKTQTKHVFFALKRAVLGF